ncbi:MAG: choice-of-anchor J domain-containing protein [Hyphomicrobiales bacterium]
MKKIYLLFCLLFSMTAFAQERSVLNEGGRTRLETAQDFTITDIDGKTHHLYEYLDQGKFIVIDFFTTWCPPCWRFHNSKVLEDLYELKGEDGTKEFIILAVESDLTTNGDHLIGIGEKTKGDWTEGTLYPICDVTSENSPAILDDYNITYYPTIIMIAPNANKDIREVGALTSAEAFVEVAENFALDNEVPISIFDYTTTIVMGSEITMDNKSEGIIDSYKWTFEGGDPATSTEINPTVKYENPGIFDITLETTNANGSHKITKEVKVLDPTVFDPFIENFEIFPVFTEANYNWKSVDVDKSNLYRSDNYPGVGEPAGFIVFDPKKTEPAMSIKAKEGLQVGCAVSPSDMSSADDWIISPKLSLKADEPMVFKFWAQTPDAEVSGKSKFKVYVSTTDDNPDSFKKISKGAYLKGTEDWKEYTFDLSKYQGQEIHVAINHISTLSYKFFVDDLRVVTTEGVNEIENKTKIFPVPSSSMVYVSSEFEFEGFKVYNQLGQLVLKQESKAKAFNINVSDLDKGIYFIHLNGEKGNISKKIIVE